MSRPKKEEYIPKEEEKEEKERSAGNERLAAILKEHKEDHFNFQDRVTWKISTGSLKLDLAVGGFIEPQLLRICGAFSEGKTSQSLEIVRNFLNTVENSKAFWMVAEGRGLSRENQERSGLKFVYSAQEWNVGTVFVLESNVFELFVKIVKDCVFNNPDKVKYAFVVDSIDGLQLRDDKKKEITEAAKICGAPALSKKMLQSLSLGMFKFGHLMILISQVTADIRIDPRAKVPNRGGEFSGGNSLLHGADFILEFKNSSNGDYILDNPSGKLNDGKTKTIGKWCKILLSKSIVEKSRKQITTYPVKFGKKPSAIWLEYEIIDILIAWDLIKKKGAWFEFADSLVNDAKENKLELKQQHQGVDNIRIYLEENKDITEFLLKKLQDVLISNS